MWPCFKARGNNPGLYGLCRDGLVSPGFLGLPDAGNPFSSSKPSLSGWDNRVRKAEGHTAGQWHCGGWSLGLLIPGPLNLPQGENTCRWISGLIKAHTSSHALPSPLKGQTWESQRRERRELNPRAWVPATVQSDMHTPSISCVQKWLLLMRKLRARNSSYTPGKHQSWFSSPKVIVSPSTTPPLTCPLCHPVTPLPCIADRSRSLLIPSRFHPSPFRAPPISIQSPDHLKPGQILVCS